MARTLHACSDTLCATMCHAGCPAACTAGACSVVQSAGGSMTRRQKIVAGESATALMSGHSAHRSARCPASGFLEPPARAPRGLQQHDHLARCFFRSSCTCLRSFVQHTPWRHQRAVSHAGLAALYVDLCQLANAEAHSATCTLGMQFYVHAQQSGPLTKSKLDARLRCTALRLATDAGWTSDASGAATS